MSYLYSEAEMAEMTANGWGDDEQHYRPLPTPDPRKAHIPDHFDIHRGHPFREALARAYEARGFHKCAATVREL